MDAIAKTLQGLRGVKDGYCDGLPHIRAARRTGEALEVDGLNLDELEKSSRRVRRMKDLYVGGWHLGADDLFEERWAALEKIYHECIGIPD